MLSEEIERTWVCAVCVTLPDESSLVSGGGSLRCQGCRRPPSPSSWPRGGSPTPGRRRQPSSSPVGEVPPHRIQGAVGHPKPGTSVPGHRWSIPFASLLNLLEAYPQDCGGKVSTDFCCDGSGRRVKGQQEISEGGCPAGRRCPLYLRAELTHDVPCHCPLQKLLSSAAGVDEVVKDLLSRM